MVYFVRDPKSGLIKIGKTDAILQRMQSLKTSIPDLELLGVLELEEPPRGKDGYRSDRSKELETLLHYKFQASRKKGEWFEATKELTSYIKKHSKLPKPVEWEEFRLEVSKAMLKKLKSLDLLPNEDKPTIRDKEWTERDGHLSVSKRTVKGYRL